MLGALISAIILVAIIKTFTGDDTSVGMAFIASIAASVVSQLLAAVALAPVESFGLVVAFSIIISVVVTGVAVQLLCSTDFKTVVKITFTYFVVRLILGVIVFAVLNAASHA